MEYKKLGRTDLDVSLICLGTMTWGRQNTQDEGFEQMDYALEQGVNFFDTAEMYAVPQSEQTCGKTETIIGNWFAERKNRDKVILASKVAGPGVTWIRNGNYKIDRASIVEAIEGSLKRLQTDYIDLYQLHWANRCETVYHFGNFWDREVKNINPEAEKENFLEVLQTLDELVKAGKIRHAGLSNETAWGTMQYLQIAKDNNLPRMVSIQNEYSLLARHFDLELQEISLFEDVGLLAWSPLAFGMLSGKYLDGKRPAGTRWTLPNCGDWRDTPQANDAVRGYIKVAEKHGLDICQMAIAFVNQRPFTTSNIIGATNMDQLKSNIDAVNLKLNDDVLKDIEEVYKDYPVPY